MKSHRYLSYQHKFYNQDISLNMNLALNKSNCSYISWFSKGKISHDKQITKEESSKISKTSKITKSK